MLLDIVNELNESDMLSEDLLAELFSIEDPYVHEQKRQELEDRAHELKIKTRFNRSYQAYKKSVSMEIATRQPSYFTEFENEPQLRTGIWHAGMDGIWTLGEAAKYMLVLIQYIRV